MFKKLETQVKKVLIEKEVSFKSLKEKQDFENELIFGDLLETLNSFKIEEAYESLSEEETPMESGEDTNPEDTKVQMHNLTVKGKIETIENKANEQIAKLQKQMKNK